MSLWPEACSSGSAALSVPADSTADHATEPGTGVQQREDAVAIQGNLASVWVVLRRHRDRDSSSPAARAHDVVDVIEHPFLFLLISEGRISNSREGIAGSCSQPARQTRGRPLWQSRPCASGSHGRAGLSNRARSRRRSYRTSALACPLTRWDSRSLIRVPGASAGIKGYGPIQAPGDRGTEVCRFRFPVDATRPRGSSFSLYQHQFSGEFGPIEVEAPYLPISAL